MGSIHTSIVFIYIALMISFSPIASSGGLTCENLDKSKCAFAVSSTGKLCMLERQSGDESYTCHTSTIEAEGIKGWVETDQCIEACGLHRSLLGISSDSLFESHFTQKLCSHQCYQGCPNIVGLYFNIAAGKGVFLPKLCEGQRANARRSITEIRSSGEAPEKQFEELVAFSPAEAPEAWAPTQFEGPVASNTVEAPTAWAHTPFEGPVPFSPVEAPVTFSFVMPPTQIGGPVAFNPVGSPVALDAPDVGAPTQIEEPVAFIPLDAPDVGAPTRFEGPVTTSPLEAPVAFSPVDTPAAWVPTQFQGPVAFSPVGLPVVFSPVDAPAQFVGPIAFNPVEAPVAE